MPRNSSGTYTLPSGNPVAPNTIIETAWANPTMSDIGSALTDSLDRFGRGSMLAPIKEIDGLFNAPAYSFAAESTLGLFRPSSGVLGIAVAGITALSISATAATFNAAVHPVWAADPVSGDDLTRKSYVNAFVAAGFLPLSGGTLTGPLNGTSSTWSGDVQAANHWIGALTSSAGTFGVKSNNGASIITWGSAAAGLGRTEFYAGAAKQFEIGTTASAVNFIRVSGGATGNGVSLSALGSDTNVSLNLFSQGTGGVGVFTNGVAQLLVSNTTGATRFVTITGSNGGNPVIGTSAGMLAISAPGRFTGAGNTGGDVASTYSLLDGIRLDFVDSSRSANNKQTELIWFGGQLLGRFNNDAYSGATSWLTVTGGQAAGVSSITFATGAGVPAMTLDSSQNATIAGGVTVGNNISGPSTAFAYTIGANPSASVTTGGFLQLYGSTNGAAGQVILGNSGVPRLTITGAGLITESSSGNELGYKRLPAASVTTGAFVAADSGKLVTASAGVTAPNATMVAGDVVSIYNPTAGAITITATVTTLTQVGTGATGNRTLAAKGFCTIVFLSGTNAIINGVGVT
jgi:hypothetical protein